MVSVSVFDSAIKEKLHLARVWMEGQIRGEGERVSWM